MKKTKYEVIEKSLCSLSNQDLFPHLSYINLLGFYQIIKAQSCLEGIIKLGFQLLGYDR